MKIVIGLWLKCQPVELKGTNVRELLGFLLLYQLSSQPLSFLPPPFRRNPSSLSLYMQLVSPQCSSAQSHWRQCKRGWGMCKADLELLEMLKKVKSQARVQAPKELEGCGLVVAHTSDKKMMVDNNKWWWFSNRKIWWCSFQVGKFIYYYFFSRSCLTFWSN